jgi:hypothetical protein
MMRAAAWILEISAMKIWLVLGVLLGVEAAVVSCGGDDNDIGNKLKEGPALVNPGFLALPLTVPGKTRASAITIYNEGNQQLVISSITLSGQDKSVFTLGDASSMTADPRRATSIPVTFKPGSEGAYVANVTIESNAADFPSFVVDLLGPAGDNTAGSPAKLYAADKTVAVNADVGNGESRGVLRYYNVGEESLIITKYDFGGPSKASFSLATGTPIPGDPCTANGLECQDSLFCLVPDLDPDNDGTPNNNAPGTCAISIPTADPIVLDIFFSGTGTATGTFSITPSTKVDEKHWAAGSPAVVTLNAQH